MKLSYSFKLHAVITVRSQSFLYEVVEGVRSSLGFLTREVNVQTSVDDNELEISFSLLSLLFFLQLGKSPLAGQCRFKYRNKNR